MDLEASRTEEGLVNHVFSISHTDDEDVVELVDTIHFGEKLVDYGVSDASSAVGGATLFEDGIEFIKDDDVQSTLVAFFFVLDIVRW